MSISATLVHGDAHLDRPALAKGDDVTLSLGGAAGGGGSIVTVHVLCKVEDVSSRAVKLIAEGMRYGAWLPLSFLRGWSSHCFTDPRFNYYRATLFLPRGFRASAGQSLLLRSAKAMAARHG